MVDTSLPYLHRTIDEYKTNKTLITDACVKEEGDLFQNVFSDAIYYLVRIRA
jgi:hypothetical protein